MHGWGFQFALNPSIFPTLGYACYVVERNHYGSNRHIRLCRTASFHPVSCGRPKSEAIRDIGIFFLTAWVFKGLTVITAAMGINNMPIYHALAVIELICFFRFYQRVLHYYSLPSGWLWLLLGFNAVDTLFLEGIYAFNSLSWSVNTSVLLLLGLLYYYDLYTRAEEIAIERYPNFYINAGLLIYASGSLFTYLLAWKILAQPAQTFFHSGWMIHSIANIIKIVTVSYGLWLVKQR